MHTQEFSFLSGRDVAPLRFSPEQAAEVLPDLFRVGIGLDEAIMRDIMVESGFAMDAAIQNGVTTPSIPNLVQFYQQWLPGFVEVVTAAQKIDEFIGRSTAGSWEDEQVVQGILENTGKAVPYGDYTNVPLADWNVNFEYRTVVRMEQGMQVGRLEEARAARMRVNSGEAKRGSAALALNVERNNIGFYGFNNGDNHTYGFLNDPQLPSYVSNPGPAWSGATFLEITADIRAGFVALRTQSQEVIDPNKTPITIAIATNCVDYLSVTNTLGTQSVMQWLNATYPNARVVSAPQLNLANGGQNVFYMYADMVPNSGSDDGRTWAQVVPATFQVLGVAQQSKSYQEDYTNATAGAFLKRPYAVVRYTGI